MRRKQRLIFLLIILVILVGIGYFISSDFKFIINDFWFTSGFLLLVLLSLVDQPYFSKDSDIFLNSVTAGISLLIINKDNRNSLFWIFFGVVSYLIVSSYVLMWFRDRKLKDENILIQLVSKFNREVGKPQTLFSALFLWGVINQYSFGSKGFNTLFAFWAIFILLNITNLYKAIYRLFTRNYEKNESAIGRIFGVQSKDIFLVKLFKTNNAVVDLFDFVEFRHSVSRLNSTRKGLIIDSYLLEEEQWIRVLTTKEIDDIFELEKVNNLEKVNKKIDENFVYKLDSIPENEFLKKFIGIVTDDSSINEVKFIYNSENLVEEGQLLQVSIKGIDEPVYYQLIEGLTSIKKIERQNEVDFIIGEAIQLGKWNSDKARFEKFGWVPAVNTPLYLTSRIEETVISDGEFQIGMIPDTNFPVIINKDIALTHHTAILGVTGTGKSIFSRNLIREYLKDSSVKVICFDFTGEYDNKFSDIEREVLITQVNERKLFLNFSQLTNEYEKFANQRDKNLIDNKNKENETIIREGLNNFFEDTQKQLSIIELPNLENTSCILEYTQHIFRNLFNLAKENSCSNHKVCVVLEEAHTLIPEWNFVGISDKKSQSLLNSIAQIALQGRKYNVGLLVIAQRTANVSKTILTQCNTIISFQEFDRTSSEFLANYFGQNISCALPNLKFRQAIAAGKAIKSNVPMIFEVPEISETDSLIENNENQ